mgnify:FL=1
MKSLFEQFGGTYRKENDYIITNFEMPDIANFEIDFFGQQHLWFLQHYLTYINLLTNGNFNEYLAEIDRQAQERFLRVVEQMKQKQEMTEQLKAINSIKWTQLMNCIRQQANELIFAELIFN